MTSKITLQVSISKAAYLISLYTQYPWCEADRGLVTEWDDRTDQPQRRQPD